MAISKKINKTELRLEKGDITNTSLEAFVHYAQSNLRLGAGFGNAIAMRGGLSITKELEAIGAVEMTEAVVTNAGKLNCKYIIHANGPKFLEQDTEAKLQKTMINALKVAEGKGIKQLIFPPMGAGFYGIPLPVCADIMLDTLKEYLSRDTIFEEVVISVMDNREYSAFEPKFEKI